MRDKPKTDVEEIRALKERKTPDQLVMEECSPKEPLFMFMLRVRRGECTPEEAAWVERFEEEFRTGPSFVERELEKRKSTKEANRKNREEIRKAKEQALVDTALDVHFRDAVEAKALGFLGRAFVMATLPHKKVKGTEFLRKNGDYTLSILAPSETGIPFGVIPRLILIWISEEVVKKKSRELILGDSLSAWMAELGMMPTGGRWGSITRLKQQMKALLASSITATWEGAGAWAMKRVSVADDAILWWDPKNPDQTSLWESKLILTERLFHELVNNSVPFDKRILKHLKRSPLALDLYIWLTYRFHYLKGRQAIPWGGLMRQFGSGYEDTPKGIAHFKTEFKKQLRKVLMLYQTAKVEITEADLVLYPSPTSIQPQFIEASK